MWLLTVTCAAFAGSVIVSTMGGSILMVPFGTILTVWHDTEGAVQVLLSEISYRLSGRWCSSPKCCSHSVSYVT